MQKLQTNRVDAFYAIINFNTQNTDMNKHWIVKSPKQYLPSNSK